MKAVVYEKYGPPEVLQLQDIPKPMPKDNEVLIKIQATTVTATDCQMRRGEPRWGRIFLGLRKPRRKILGIEMAGDVEAIGKRVTRFKPGDAVFGAAMMKMSCTAEYVCLREKAGLALKPGNMSYEEAAAFPDGAQTALTFLKHVGKLQQGQAVLINGASGSVGTFAVQLAKYFGAHVTGVCSTTNVALVKSLGADQVIDYTQEDFTQSDKRYDIIFDTVNKRSFARCKRVLKPGGAYLVTMFTPAMIPQLLGSAVVELLPGQQTRKRMKTGMEMSKPEGLNFLKELIEAGEVKSVIDHVYPLEQIVEAHRYVDKGHKKGNVVITIS